MIDRPGPRPEGAPAVGEALLTPDQESRIGPPSPADTPLGADQSHDLEDTIQADLRAAAARRQIDQTAELTAAANTGGATAYFHELRDIRDKYSREIADAPTPHEADRLRDERHVRIRAAWQERRILAVQEALEPDWQEALYEDREARMVAKVDMDYSHLRERVRDVGIRGHGVREESGTGAAALPAHEPTGLVESRDKAIAETRELARKINQTAVGTEHKVSQATREKREITERFDHGNSPDIEEQAAANHDALLLDTLPFEVKRSGGWAHKKENRGPQVIEAFYRSEANPNVVVVERRLRRTDKLLSQTVLTTELPVREVKPTGFRDAQPVRDAWQQEYRLPRDFAKSERLEAIRKADKAPTVHKATFGDYVAYGSVDLGGVAQEYYGASEAEVMRSNRRKRRPRSCLELFVQGTLPD